MSDIVLKTIDEDKLYTDLGYRYQYLCDFIGISEKDVNLIHGSASILGPKVELLVDAVYNKLFSFTCTKKVFFRERQKYDEPTTNATIENYDLNKPQIGMRKSSLTRFIVRLVTKPYDGAMLEELDRMGRIHTPTGGRTSINVELIHMQALMAFLQDAIIAELYQYYDSQAEGCKEFDVSGTVRAFCKVLAVLGQFISRWYEIPRGEKTATSLPVLPIVAAVAAVAAPVVAAYFLTS